MQNERAAWNAIRDTTDLKVLGSFLTSYPGGPHAGEAQTRLDTLRKAEAEEQAAAEAKREELSAWNDVKDTSDVSALNAFIAKYPNGEHAGEAQARLDTLRKAEAEKQAAAEAKQKELAAWNDVKDTSDFSGLNAFIAKYPSGAHVGEAQARLDKLKAESEEASAWSDVKDTSDMGALSAFLQKYPDGAHAGKAQARLDTLRKARQKNKLLKRSGRNSPPGMMSRIRAMSRH